MADLTTATPPAKPFPLVPVLAAAIAAACGPLIWVGLYRGLGGNIWLPAVLIGLVVGLAARLTSRGSDRRLPWIAAGLTLASCVASYLITGLYVVSWNQPVALADVARFLVNDLFSIVMIAIGCYVAHLTATRYG